MRLLIITQKVDKDDSVLGFFHRWIEEFAKHFDSIIVICLEEGGHKLPPNVKVLSLGKERFNKVYPKQVQLLVNAIRRMHYAIYFYQYILRERKFYDAVFNHMNQEYVILGGIFWKIFGKKIMLWRNHARGNWLTGIAVLLAHKVFCTSPQSFTARFKKTELMPVGVDTELFRRKPEILRKRNSILCLGRISPVKHLDTVIRAVAGLRNRNIEVELSLVGDSPSRDTEYMENLKFLAKDLKTNDTILFSKGVSNNQTVGLYNSCEIFVNATPDGSMDKTIFEAMACETLVVVANRSLTNKIGSNLIFNDDITLISTIENILSMPTDRKNALGISLREYVVREHSLSLLSEQLAKICDTI